MSAISEQRERIDELERRILILESALVTLLEKSNIQDLSGELVKVVEDEYGYKHRKPIGY